MSIQPGGSKKINVFVHRCASIGRRISQLGGIVAVQVVMVTNKRIHHESGIQLEVQIMSRLQYQFPDLYLNVIKP